ncbi:MAG TPA: DUF711 family protein [Anaerolineaceae bacterium]|nr:DUF711 family protein [Anaerolineaceae bacterium]
MKIRSITSFYDPGASGASATLDHLTNLTSVARSRFESAGYEVQTTRLATVPFPGLVPSCCDESAIHLVKLLEHEASSHGFAYISFGPALPEYPDSYRLIPTMLAETENAFFSGVVATADGQVHLPAVRACAEIIAAAATITPDGFANLRFSAIANLPPGGPFFPSGYHAPGQPPRFAIAAEAADVVYQAFSSAQTLVEARRTALDALEAHAQALEAIAESIRREFDVAFGGFDFSPAPHPSEGRSLGGALAALGVPALGQNGSLAAAAFLADLLDRGRWPRAGFNGLMMPVLEDAVLAARSAAGDLTVKDLLLYSAVCGTGLDTVPLPGDSTPDQLSAVLLDVAALSIRLDKPLTARLMPIPGKIAGDPTDFVFDYFANGRVMALPSSGLSGLLAGEESFDLKPRHTRK